MDRLRFELLLGHSGGEIREHPTSQAGGGGGTGSDDEVLPDRTAEPGPSEQPPETGHPYDDSQADDEFTVMDVDEEQSEEVAPRPPRKRGRFENDRSNSMRQGEGASSSSMRRIRRRSIKEERAREETEGGHKEQRNIQSSARARAGSLSDCSRAVGPTPPSAVFGVHNCS